MRTCNLRRFIWYYRAEGASEKIIKNLHYISDLILTKPKMLHAEPLVRDVEIVRKTHTLLETVLLHTLIVRKL